MPALDTEIERVTAAVLRCRREMDAVMNAIDAEGGPQSAHEHDATWKRAAGKLQRAGAWLCVLLRKRGTADDLSLARAAEMGAWP
jgi:hypothetical protein